MRIYDALQICLKPKDIDREKLDLAAQIVGMSLNRAIQYLELAREPIIKAIGTGDQFGLPTSKMP